MNITGKLFAKDSFRATEKYWIISISLIRNLIELIVRRRNKFF